MVSITLAFSKVFAYEDIICVGHRGGLSIEACNRSFETLDDYASSERTENLSSVNIQVKGSTSLNSTLVFFKVSDLSFIGNMTEIRCHGNNSGLMFRKCTNVRIQGLTFTSCGSVQASTSTDFRSSKNQTLKLKSALYFLYCTNMSISHTDIQHSDGVGLVIYDSDGLVNITKCNFTGNKIGPQSQSHFAGGGGIHIEITSCPVASICDDWRHLPDTFNSNTIFIIDTCTFWGNIASTLFEELSTIVTKPYSKQRLGRGGGLFLSLGRYSSNIAVSITNCSFIQNMAVWGGGVFLSIRDSSVNNLIHLERCVFLENIATRSDGGLSMNFNFKRDELKNNFVDVEHCNFVRNSADINGGLGMFNSHKTLGGTGNNMRVNNCTWIENSAYYGAAIGVGSEKYFSQQGGSIHFVSCSFCRNIVKLNFTSKESYSYKRAVFSVTKEYIDFEGSTTFEDNRGTALQAVSTIIQFLPFASVQFVNNTGVDGGAIALISLSIIFVQMNSQFIFRENRALRYGGAIYIENVDVLDPFLFADSKCPIQYREASDGEYRNVSFTFESNTAGFYPDVSFGNSIHFSSVDSCVYLCTQNVSSSFSIHNVFKCIGHVQNLDELEKKKEFATLDRRFMVDESENRVYYNRTIHVIPGKEFGLTVTTVDDFNNSVFSVYLAKTMHLNGNSGLKIDAAYRAVSSAVPRLLIYGNPHDKGVLELYSTGFYQYKLKLEIEVLPCTPGYSVISQVIETTGGVDEVHICSCYNKKNFYLGVLCRNDYDKFRTSIAHGYWAGYVINNTISKSVEPEDSANFYTATCPLSFCQYQIQNKSGSNTSYDFPAANLPEQIDLFICGESRTGILCGQCREGYSVFFHSFEYDCFPNNLCHIGWLFYILSELLPLTIIFVVVMVFNISFTTGAVNGFIFFAQTIDSLLINNNYATNLHFYQRKELLWFYRSHQVIYRFFNLDFFGIDHLSFCLWQGASTLDIKVFKFVSVTYAFILVAVTILVLNKISLTGRYLPFKLRNMGNYVIQGLSAFLILCYAQCVVVSFQLLFSIHLRGIDFMNTKQLYVFYNGDILFFSTRHLPYAIPALICLVTLIMMPPLILLWHPFVKQLLAKCGLGESRLVIVIDNILFVNKLKPLVDSFQSCFKDKYRFLAGLLFLYRVVLLLGLLVIKQSQLFVLVSIIILLMLLFHSILQPYKKRWHNIINGFFLANMLAINTISLSINHALVNHDEVTKHFIYSISVIQEVLICIPIVYILAYATWSIVNSIRQKYQCTPTIVDYELSLREDHSRSLMESEYREMDY